jgi:hypothetical protein
MWKAAHDRLASTRETCPRAPNGTLQSKPCNGAESKYLMAGMARCGTCGASMIVLSRSHGRQRARFLACGGYHQRRKTTCSNSLEIRIEKVDDAVLTAFERDLLDPDIIREAMHRAVAAVQTPGDDPARRRPALQKAVEAVEGELGRLATAIALGGGTVTLVAGASERRAETPSRPNWRRSTCRGFGRCRRLGS